MRSWRTEVRRRSFFFILLLAGYFLLPVSVLARDNILIGDLSASYDYTKRNYTDTAVTVVPAGEEGAGGTVVAPVENRGGDRREYTISPRLTFSSQGQTDLLELSYAPGFVYDDLEYTIRVDHSFGLTAEKHLTQRWFLSLHDTYFLGNDPATETDLRTAESPATGIRQAETEPQTEEAGPVEEDTGALDERVGSRRYWRNTAELLAEYTYGPGSLVGAGYTYEMLRNPGSDPNGYTEYDRHSLMAHVAHRFNAKWRIDFQGNYSKGIFDEPAVVAVTPVVEEEGEEATAAEILRPESGLSSDLQEYSGATRLDYAWSNHATFFLGDDSMRTDYDDPLRRDNWAHNVALGLDYYFDRHFYVTLSGGPAFSKLGEQSWETDYNVYASVTRLFLHSSLTGHISKSYDVQNFDGRGNGLTDTWETGIDYTYNFTQNFSMALTASYSDERRLQYPYTNTLVTVTGEDTVAGEDLVELVEGFDYHEKLFEAGINLSYIFMRWYTLSGGYTYAKDETGLAGSSDYDEHRVFVQVSVSKNLFRW